MSWKKGLALTLPKEVGAEEFDQIIRLHEAFISGRRGGMRAIRRLIVARRLRCDRRDLSDADLTGADLSGTTFIASRLQRTSLHCANLSRANFTGADLSRADLRGANISGATLSGAVLDEADLRAAVLVASDALVGLRWIGGAGTLAGARSGGDQTGEIVAHSVDFSNATLKGARLRGANLKNANLANANLADADLYGARLEGAVLTGAILTGVDVNLLGLAPARLKDCVVDPTAEAIAEALNLLEQAEGMDRWARTSGREGAPARLDGKDLRPLAQRLAGLRMPGLSARNVTAIGVSFKGAQLAGATFDDADLRSADFTEADLRGASFRGANLAHAKFGGSDLSDLALVNGRVRKVSLSYAIVVGTGLLALQHAEELARREDEAARLIELEDATSAPSTL
ncbi:MAG: pentapeptide repeat-containing protein [Pseudomonadota bacterium]